MTVLMGPSLRKGGGNFFAPVGRLWTSVARAVRTPPRPLAEEEGLVPRVPLLLTAGTSPSGVAGTAGGGRGFSAPPLPPPAARTGRRPRRRRWREGHCNGRRGAAGAASATATGDDTGGGGGHLACGLAAASGRRPGDAGGGRVLATSGEVQLALLPPLQRAVTPAEVEGRCRHLARCRRTQTRRVPRHLTRRLRWWTVVVAAAAVAGAVVAAPTPARPMPGSLIAPRKASGAAVALAEAEGHLQ